MSSTFDGFTVWFATGSVHLYGEESLREVADHAREIAAGLDASAEIPVRIVWRPTVASPEEARLLALEANGDDTCLGVIAWMHTFSPARMWIGGLRALLKPLLHLHTQFNRELPWGEIDMDFMNLNQSAHGDREFGHIQARMRVARKTVVGHWSDPAALRRIGTWTRAARGWHEAQSLRVARFGDNMRHVAVTEGDKVEAEATFGFSVNGFGVGELVAAVADVGEAAIGDLVEKYEDQYDVVDELRRGGARHDALREAARIEIGLRTFLDDGGFAAFTDTFEDLGGLRQLPGIAAQRLMADGYGFAAEGDWKHAALLRIVKSMGEGESGGTSFMEDYTYHLGPERPLILGAHMLEICPSITDERPACEIHPLAHGQREDPVRLVFTAAPGPGVVVSLVDLGDRFRLVANEIELVSPEAELQHLPVARAVWDPKPSLATSAEAWLLAGGAHHTVLTTAVDTEAVEDFAEIARVELLLIDERTTIRDFKNELRWNQAYHHLARGV
jgi:L-arabinose isomerase